MSDAARKAADAMARFEGRHAERATVHVAGGAPLVVRESPGPSAWDPRRLHLAQLVVEGLAEDGAEPFECSACLRLHVRARTGFEISAATANALRLLRREILFVLAHRRPAC